MRNGQTRLFLGQYCNLLAQSGEALARLSPLSAQAKGQALLNLRCTGSEGGLLGRTLLTLVSNKVRQFWQKVLAACQKGATPHCINNIPRPTCGAGRRICMAVRMDASRT